MELVELEKRIEELEYRLTSLLKIVIVLLISILVTIIGSAIKLFILK